MTGVQTCAQPQLVLERQVERQAFGQPQVFKQPQIELEVQKQKYVERQILAPPQRPKLILTSVGEKPKQRLKQVPIYSVSVRRRGAFSPIAVEKTFREAIKIGEAKALGTLARTFKVKQTGFKEQFAIDNFGEPDLRIFREYQIRRGKKIPLPFGTYIQKAQYSLGSFGERREIQLARQQARELNKLMNM